MNIRTIIGHGKRGRPTGFRLSEITKRAISASKLGQKHKEETKCKISKSLIMYFKRKNPLSAELINMYSIFDDIELSDWLYNTADELNSFLDIKTLKTLRNVRKIELSVGKDIEYYSHAITPETIFLFKEACELTGKNPDEMINEPWAQ